MVYSGLVPGIGGILHAPQSPGHSGPHLFAGTLRGFPSLLCENFNLHLSRRHPAEQPDTADQPAALFGDTGFMLENAPGMPAYFQSGTDGALNLAWLRTSGRPAGAPTAQRIASISFPLLLSLRFVEPY
ncbi:hypothetical protein Q4I30_008029 [Leishmania utingensis]|uniref:Uncharacterized protein n=1 Tax=Leishmania utingensis TaxID=653362 RepID=A0AAW2ZUH0_9TRYP